MGDVIFARPRHVYDSYSDLYTLIRLSGYPLIYFDEIQPDSDNCYILTLLNGETNNGWPDAKARIILFDLEWRLEGEYPVIPGIVETWAADPWYAQRIGAKYVPLGSHSELAGPRDNAPLQSYDTIMLAYMTNRRMQMREWLRDRDVTIAPQGWGAERHQSICQSKTMLHVHQHDGIYTIAPQRFALAAAYHMPLISENVGEDTLFGDSVMWVEYGDMAAFVANEGRGDVSHYGEALYNKLCVEHTFRKEIEAAA